MHGECLPDRHEQAGDADCDADEDHLSGKLSTHLCTPLTSLRVDNSGLNPSPNPSYTSSERAQYGGL